MAEEKWKIIEGYASRYSVSSMGRVRNCKGMILKQGLNSSGYRNVPLSLHGTQKRVLVHRLVATAFLEKKQCDAEVNHKNGVKEDNSVDNLEWTTKRANHLHKVYVLGKNTALPKPVRCVETGELFPSVTIASFCKKLKNPICISNAINGKRKTAGGYHWELVNNRKENSYVN